MSEPNEPAPPPAAPKPASEPKPPRKTTLQQIIETSVHGLKDLLPAAALAAAVPMLVLGAMPAGNEKVMLTVIGALAGFLTGRASKGTPQ